jgi:hypothetical protein
MYIVDTDEKLFTEIDTTMRRLRHLFLYFQNPETEMTVDELDTWHKKCSEYQNELNNLIRKCASRIHLMRD